MFTSEFKPTEQAEEILKKRYYLKDENWVKLCRRVATFLADNDEEKEKFFKVMVEGKLIPNSPALMNAGTYHPQCSACFAWTVPDSIEGIFSSLKDACQVFQSGGGVGFNFSEIRPINFPVRGNIGVASGVISFMKAYDVAIGEMKQGFRRRGAAIGLLRIDHPEIIKFIKCKRQDKIFSNFNISVAITDDFMKNLQDNPSNTFYTQWKHDDTILHYGISKKDDLPNMYTFDYKNYVEKPYFSTDDLYTYKDVWDLICENAWASGEPGLIFIDEIHRKNGKDFNAVNPCLTGDTLVYTVINKNLDKKLVTIKELADNGKDVPVVCYGDGKLQVKTMYNPRITGYNQKIIKITFDDETNIRVTENHKFMTINKKFVAVKDLKIGSKLKIWDTNILCELTNEYDSSYNVNINPYDKLIQKNCEYCKKVFYVGYEHREICFCSSICAFKFTKRYNTKIFGFEKQDRFMQYRKRFEKIDVDAGENKRILDPIYSFYNSNSEFKEKNNENSRTIVAIEEDGYENVYNGTVAEYHNYMIAPYNSDVTKIKCFYNNKQCGETPLEDYGSCVLAAIDVSKFVVDNTLKSNELTETIEIGVDLLNRIIDKGIFPLQKIADKVKATRQIGLGIMGYADMLIKLASVDQSQEQIIVDINKYTYGKYECVLYTKHFIEYFNKTARYYSDSKGYKNKAVTSLMPTGTVSLIANTSASIEPNFAWKTIHHRNGLQDTIVYHPLAKSYLENNIPLPSYFVTAQDVTPEQHVEMLAAMQANIELGISKTINMPNSATIEDVKKAYKLAYKLQCKGVTVYRDGCRSDQVLSTDQKENKKESEPVVPVQKQKEELQVGKFNKITFNPINDPKEDQVRKRPRVLFGATYKIQTPGGTIYLTINEDKEGIREVIINVNKAGTEIASHVSTEGRLISTGLKYRVPIDALISQLKNQKSSPVWDYNWKSSVKSIPDAVAQIIEDFIENYEGFSEFIEEPMKQQANIVDEDEEDSEDEENNSNKKNKKEQLSGEVCPECGELTYIKEGGCTICKSCGFSACGG